MKRVSRLLCITIAGFMTVFSITTSKVQAQTVDIDALGAIGMDVVNSIREGYEGSVVARMVGRAGAKAPTGSKGIAFEVILKDKMNAISTFTDKCTTQLSASSTDQLADLITVDKAGQVVEYIQCKNSTSDGGVRAIINQIKSGQYDEATLIATKESAEALTEAATQAGLQVEIVDSNISENVTIRIANKFLQQLTAEEVAKLANRSGGIAAAIGASISVLESVISGDSIEETIGEASIEAGKSYLSGATACAAGELATAGLVAVEAGTAVSAIAPVIVVLGVGAVVYAGADTIAEKTGLEERMTYGINAVEDWTMKTANNIKEEVENLHIKETVEEMDIDGRFATAKATVSEKIDSLRE